MDKFWARVDRAGDSECWPWLGYRNPQGYGLVSFNGRTQGAHRVSWVLEHGREISQGAVVAHFCDNPPCVNPGHLWVTSQKENVAGCATKGRRNQGRSWRSNGQAKLTPALADRVRSSQGTQKEIAARFGISQSLVSMIKSGKAWAQ